MNIIIFTARSDDFVSCCLFDFLVGGHRVLAVRGVVSEVEVNAATRVVAGSQQT